MSARRRMHVGGAAVLALALFAEATASADGSNPTDRARAQQLFDSGLADLAAGQFASACPKFAASQEADPKTTTLLNLGQCYESLGRFASAWTVFREAQALARKVNRPNLESAARASVDAVAPKVSRLTVTVAESARVAGLGVALDGSKLAPAEWETGIPIDDGDHEIVAAAPGRITFRQRVTIRGANRTVEVPGLASEPPAPRVAPAVPASPERAPSWWTSTRTAGVIVGGVGGLATAGGLIVALVAKSNYDGARAQCHGQAVDDCPRPAVVDADSARSLATVGTVTIIAGAAVLAAGAVLILVGGRRDPARVQVGFVPTGLVGTW